jgi:hypothetical protein
MLVRTEKIDPKDYPFKKFIDEQKHLDTDEHRHKIKPVRHKIDECLKGKEHLFCDKEQLCPLGKYRRPKKMMEAESKGFASVKEMFDADKKAEEDAKEKKVEQQQKQIDDLQEMVKALMAKLN